MLREIAFTVGEDEVEALSDALLEAGALSVAVEDEDAGSADEQALYGEPGLPAPRGGWRRSRLAVLLDAGADPAQVLVAAADAIGKTPPTLSSSRIVEDADWVRLTQAQFPPTQVGERLWIVPSWHEPPEPDAINVRIDPGVAFGTGTHPTTRLCLRWLDENLRGGERVLDYGCGSGILAIAAAKLGAGLVIGTDIDAQALEAARANSLINGLDESRARYTALDALPSGANGQFDVVLANILANPLRVLAPALLARVNVRGALVLSGILERQADELITLYREVDRQVDLALWHAEDGWVCLAGRRSG